MTDKRNTRMAHLSQNTYTKAKNAILCLFMARFDVITVGAATQDIFLRSSAFEVTKDASAPDGVETCFPLGSKIGVDELITASGGGATNAAATFAGLGLKTGCICRVGKDQAGKIILKELKRRRISKKFVQRDPRLPTATSIILLAGGGHRAILTYRGVSNALRTDELPRKLKARWLYATSFGGDARLLRTMFEKAEQKKVKVAWNPGGRELALGLTKLTMFLRITDVLILNREEAALLSGKSAQDMRGLIKALKDLPRQALTITDGQKGAYLCAEGKVWFAPSLKAKRINTTGAGDAFGSALVTGLIHQLAPEDALRLAMLNATSVVSHMGAKTGVLQNMPTEREMKRIRVKTIPIT